MKKTIKYDRNTRDFRADVDGILIGFYRSIMDAEAACNDYVFDALTHGDTRTATELDGGPVEGVHYCANCGALLHCECDDAAYAGVTA